MPDWRGLDHPHPSSPSSTRNEGVGGSGTSTTVSGGGQIDHLGWRADDRYRLARVVTGDDGCLSSCSGLLWSILWSKGGPTASSVSTSRPASAHRREPVVPVAGSREQSPRPFLVRHRDTLEYELKSPEKNRLVTQPFSITSPLASPASTGRDPTRQAGEGLVFRLLSCEITRLGARFPVEIWGLHDDRYRE